MTITTLPLEKIQKLVDEYIRPGKEMYARFHDEALYLKTGNLSYIRKYAGKGTRIFIGFLDLKEEDKAKYNMKPGDMLMIDTIMLAITSQPITIDKFIIKPDGSYYKIYDYKRLSPKHKSLIVTRK